MRTEKIYVVFDGTSAYIIPENELVYEKQTNNVTVLNWFVDIESASIFCDEQNEQF